jgi:hypothetical protein
MRLKQAMKDYIRLVDGGEGRGTEALALRTELEKYWGGHRLLHSADLDMQKQELLAKLMAEPNKS